MVKVIAHMGRMGASGNIAAAGVFLQWTLGRPPEALPWHLQDRTTLDDVIGEMDHFMRR